MGVPHIGHTSTWWCPHLLLHLLHLHLIISGLVLLLIGFIYCFSRIWLSGFYDNLLASCKPGGRATSDDDIRALVQNNGFTSTGAGKQRMSVVSTGGYFVKTAQDWD